MTTQNFSIPAILCQHLQLWATIDISVHLYIYAGWQCISINNGSVNSGIVKNGTAQNLSRGAIVWDKEQAWENVMGVRQSTQTRGRGSRLVLSYGIPGNFRTLLHTFMLTEPHYWHSSSHQHLDDYRYDAAYKGRILDFLWDFASSDLEVT